ncbi:MAG: type II toxin-antitoxin system RelE/ParE family toxin [Bacteroidales bacterium]|nr:type II toxin-antitoxin system RelE/ParE family toxin [Bacteroidales bacterium]
MERKTILVKSNKHEKTLIYIDSEKDTGILHFILSDAVHKEFKIISELLLENARNKEKYLKVFNNVYEMRFTNNGRNDRIYCVEIKSEKKRVIVMAELYLSKDQQKIPKKIIDKIKTQITKYTYHV